MTFSSVSGAGAAGSIDSDGYVSRKTNMDLPQQAIASGDLATAQQAYANIQTSLPGAASGTAGATGQIQTDFQKLGAALSSGDAAGAKSALATLHQDAQKARGRVPPPPSRGRGGGAVESGSSVARQHLLDQA